MDNKVVVGIAALVGALVLYRILGAISRKGSSDGDSYGYEQEIEKILTSDENKVKGRYE